MKERDNGKQVQSENNSRTEEREKSLSRVQLLIGAWALGIGAIAIAYVTYTQFL